MFKHLLPSISYNDILVPTSVSNIVPSVSETVLPSSLPATDSSTLLHLIDIDALQHQHYDPQLHNLHLFEFLLVSNKHLDT